MRFLFGRAPMTFARLLVSFLTIITLMLVPILFLQAHIARITLERQDHANENYIDNVASICDRLFLGLRGSAGELLTRNDYSDYVQTLNRYDDDFATYAMRIKTQLAIINGQYPELMSVSVYARKGDGAEFLLSSMGSFDTPQFLGQMREGLGDNYDDLRTGLDDPFAFRLLSRGYADDASDHSYVLLFRNRYISSASSLMFEISERKLFERIEAQNITNVTECYLFDAVGQRFVNTSDPLGIYAPQTAEAMQGALARGDRTIRIDRVDYAMRARTSVVPGLYYIALTPNRSLLMSMDASFRRTIWLSIAFVFVSMAIAALYSRWISRPLQRMIANLRDMQENYDTLTLKYARLGSMQRMSRDALAELMLARIAMGGDVRQFYDRLAAEDDLSDRSLYVFDVGVEGMTRERPFPALCAAIASALPGWAWAVEIAPARFAMLWMLKPGVWDAARIAAEHAIREAIDQTRCHVRCAASPACDGPEAAVEAFRDLHAVLEGVSVNAACHIFIDAEDRGTDEAPVDFPATKRRLAALLAQGDAAAIEAELDALFDALFDGGVSLRLFSEWMSELLLLLHTNAMQLFAEPEERRFSMDERAERLRREGDPGAQRALVRAEFAEAARRMKQAQCAQSTIRDMIGFIDEMRGDVHINDMAQRFGFAPNYLSQYFKKHTGVTFSSYVNAKKIEYAKLDLATTDKTIAAIGQELGFSSSSSFIRMFKQIVGVTPAVYRQLGME